MTCSRVDLPDPDGPMTATNSPNASSMSTPRSASTQRPSARYSFTSLRVRSITGTGRR